MNAINNYRYFYTPSTTAEKLLNVSDAMGCVYERHFFYNRDFLNNNLIMFVTKGALFVEQFGKKYVLHENEGILLELTKPHKYYFDKNIDSHIIWFHFRGKPSQVVIDELSRHGELPLTFREPNMDKYIFELFEATKLEDATREFDISSIIYNIVLNVTKSSIFKIQTNDKKYGSFSSEIDNYIFININSRFNLEDMAKHFKLSKYYFCRMFKEHFNTTPFKYINEKKIELAKSMLNQTSYSISDISEYLCFFDQGYFTNVFKSVVGCSPMKYRKANSCL
jgi:AraC-like DNA-binding protein